MRSCQRAERWPEKTRVFLAFDVRSLGLPAVSLAFFQQSACLPTALLQLHMWQNQQKKRTHEGQAQLLLPEPRESLPRPNCLGAVPQR